MQQETTKLYMNDMTRQKLYDLFQVMRVDKITELDEWLTGLPELDKKEILLAKFFSKDLKFNISSWQKQELLMNFVGPILNIINFNRLYKIGLFAKRSIAATYENHELEGEADLIISNNIYNNEPPYYAFGAIRPEITSDNEDPIGRNLTAMLVGQAQNKNEEVIYGYYTIGRHWYFIVLKGKEYAVSKSYSATHDDDILEVVKILKALRSILFKKLGIDETTLN